MAYVHGLVEEGNPWDLGILDSLRVEEFPGGWDKENLNKPEPADRRLVSSLSVKT